MAIRLLVFMAILQLALTAPNPDPEDIIVNVEQAVNVDGCCPEPRPRNTKVCTYNGRRGICSNEPEPPFIVDVGTQECEYECNCYVEAFVCALGDETYPIGAMAQGTCMELECIESTDITGAAWNYTGYIDKDECGECQIFGDPHILPFSNAKYHYQGTGTFIVTQTGLPVPNRLGMRVTSQFDKQGAPWDYYSAPRSVNYFEPGLQVKVNLPAFSNLGCFPPTAGANCDIEVIVNGVDVTGRIPTEGELFFARAPGTGAVFIIEHNHVGNSRLSTSKCMNIVGFNGLSMSLCISGAFYYSFLYVWAKPHLMGQLYGLCDTYISDQNLDRYDYTLPAGHGYWTNNTTRLAQSWQTEGDHILQPDRSRCTNLTEMWKVQRQCGDIVDYICDIAPHELCEAYFDGCVYDLCRVEFPDYYALGYGDHYLIESHFNHL